MMGKGKGGMDMAAMMAKMGKGGGQPDPKSQLANLIVKLDLLTQKPLKIDLSKDQAKKVAEEVRTLAKGEPDPGEVREHLDNLLKILEDHKEALIAAGFRWPSAENGQNGPGGEPSLDMPKHLKALEERLGAGK
jgi:hypothetical protein